MFLTPANEKALSHGLLDVLIRAGLVAVLVMACCELRCAWPSRRRPDHSVRREHGIGGRCGA